MSTNMERNSKPRKFTNLADLDLFIHHQYRDETGAERLCLEVGAVRRMKTYFDRLEHQVSRIAASQVPVCLQHSRGIDLSTDGRFLWQAIRDVEREAPQDICEGRRLTQKLKLGLHLARKWAPRLRPYVGISSNDLNVNQDYPRRIMLHIANVIRRVCSSRKFRNLVNNDTRNAKENYLSCANLMISLLREDPRLLILRVDLYFEGDAKVFSECEAAEKAYDKFMRNLSENRIVPNVLGYIGKRENGLERRIHYHVLVALDGDHHHQSYGLTELLGQFWVHQCVGAESLASHYNCWLRRDEHEFNCMGLLHYKDSHMLMGLRLAIEYLCKEGTHILVAKELGRNLRKSLSPRRSEETVRPGARKKRDRDLGAAKQVLLTLDLQSRVKRYS